MKSVLISIQPKYVELIASGEKTIEVRKTKPNLATPFKCYIYMTKKKRLLAIFRKGNYIFSDDHKAGKFDETIFVKDDYYWSGKVIGEFVCDRIDNYECELWNDEAYELIRQFHYNEYGDIEYEYGAENNENCEMLNKACLTWQDIRKYLGQGLNNCYAWHISNLKIYDKPKDLSEFRKPCKFAYSSYEEGTCYEDCIQGKLEDCRCFCLPITRPPQSWCYVESLGE